MSAPRYRLEPRLHATHLEVVCHGVMDLAGFTDLTYMMLREGKKKGVDRCLVDIRGADTDITTVDRYDLAALAADTLPGFKTATLIRKGMVRNTLYENAATNRGLATLISDDEPAALEWLLT